MSQKNSWSKEAGYIWAMIGSAVGFANILSFSALCYKNGGGAFLIPYLIAHLFVGIPMLFLEGIIGQKTNLPLVTAYGYIKKNAKVLGWFAVLTCATIGGFYMVLTGFSVAYTYFSAFQLIPHDSATFFKQAFLHDSGSLTQWGGIALSVLIATLIVAFASWLVLMRNIQTGVEKICTIFLPLLGILMLAFTIAVCFLPGATEGFKNYLTPDFSYLSNWAVWRDVFGQVFFSLSLGLGIVTGYSRHNPPNFSVRRAMVKVAIGDFTISFISGFAIFGCIGYMSSQTGMPFSSIVTSDSAFEIGFVIFPMLLEQFGMLARILGPLFFFCIFIAGITGVFSIVESIAGNIEVEFQKGRKMAVGIAMLVVTVLAVPFCMGNGQHLLGALAPMVLGYNMLIGGIAEIALFLIFFKSISSDAIWFSNKGRHYSYYALKFFVFPLLSLILFASLFSEVRSGFGVAETIRWTWLTILVLGSLLLSRRKSKELIAA